MKKKGAARLFCYALVFFLATLPMYGLRCTSEDMGYDPAYWAKYFYYAYIYRPREEAARQQEQQEQEPEPLRLSDLKDSAAFSREGLSLLEAVYAFAGAAEDMPLETVLAALPAALETAESLGAISKGDANTLKKAFNDKEALLELLSYYTWADRVGSRQTSLPSALRPDKMKPGGATLEQLIWILQNATAQVKLKQVGYLGNKDAGSESGGDSFDCSYCDTPAGADDPSCARYCN